VIASVVGPIADANGVPRHYVRMTVFDEAPNTRTTGWLQIDLDTLAVTPAPSFSPPSAQCRTGGTAIVPAPVQFPEWVEPDSGIVLISETIRSNRRIPGRNDEASSYYYLSYNATDADPVGVVPPASANPPPVELSVRRTTCRK
jgi:hypothetical protein